MISDGSPSFASVTVQGSDICESDIVESDELLYVLWYNYITLNTKRHKPLIGCISVASSWVLIDRVLLTATKKGWDVIMTINFTIFFGVTNHTFTFYNCYDCYHRSDCEACDYSSRNPLGGALGPPFSWRSEISFYVEKYVCWIEEIQIFFAEILKLLIDN